MTTQNLLLWGFDSGSHKQAISQILHTYKFSVTAWFQSKPNGATPSIHQLNTLPDTLLSHYSDIDVPSFVYEAAYKYFSEYCLIYQRHTIVASKSATAIYDKFNASIRIAYNIIIGCNTNVALFCNMPHEGFDLVLYAVLRLLNRRVFVFYQSIFPGRHLILRDDLSFKMEQLVTTSKPFADINQYFLSGAQSITDSLPSTRSYSALPYPIGKRQLISRVAYAFFLLSLGRLYRAANQFRFVDASLRYLRNRRLVFSSKIPEDLKYIYFPLHLQPECTTTPMGGIYQDQLLAIEQLSQLLPQNWKILVKENPRQGPSHRDSEFFIRLALIKNVIPVRNIDTHLLLSDAVIVATITGSVAMESVASGKPVIIFGNSYFKILDGVYSFSDNLDFEAIVNSNNSLQIGESSLSILSTFLHEGIVDEDYLDFSSITVEKNSQLVYLSISRALALATS